MKKIINTLSRAIQAVLAAPIKLPAKVVGIVKYVAVALGILEAVVGDGEDTGDDATDTGGERHVEKP